MRPDYIRRFQQMVDELRQSADIAVSRVHIAPPVSEDAIARVHERLGFALSDRILDFYRQANGLALEWIPKDHPAYDPDSHDEEQSEPFDMVPQDVPGGVINVYPFESLVDDYEDVFWFRHMAGDKTELRGKSYDLLPFSKSIRPFDYYSEYTMAALLFVEREPDPPVLLGDDHGATFTTFPPTDFESYMEGVLALRGSWVGRERFFCRADRPPPGTPEAWREVAPSLEELVRWSLEHDPEGGFQERDEDDFDGADELDDEFEPSEELAADDDAFEDDVT